MKRRLSVHESSEPVSVELADIATILQMNHSYPVAEPAKPRRTEPVRRSRRRPCTCGKCRTCLDNARWESVFQRKFADPFYYSLREPKQGSSLNGF
jgi:hypothetical protein